MLKVQIETLGQFKVKVDLNVPATITAVFGPSGAGKSTMLRAVAGLEPCHGIIEFNGTEWLSTESHINLKSQQRPIGYVRQNARLFPHMSVRGNLRYPIKHSKRSGHKIEFDQVVADFELEPLLERRPNEISGGETQRVILARMLLSQPKLMLLDEPLTGLDLQRKAEILPFLESLHLHYDMPTLYVSHAVDEVTALCSHTIVLDEGRVRASGPTEDVLERRDLDELLGDVDASSLVHATALEHDAKYGLTQLKVEDSEWSVPMHIDLEKGEHTTLRIRARDVALARDKPDQISVRNILQGRIVEIEAQENGPAADCIVQNGETRLRARITRASLDELQFQVGDSVYALIKSVTLG